MAYRAAKPPVLVLAPPRFVAPLGVMRSLSKLGTRVYGLEHEEPSIAGSSRFCAGRFRVGRNGRPVDLSETVILDQLVAAGRRLGGRAVLMAASDEWAIFVAAHSSELEVVFTLPDIPIELVRALTSKTTLHDLALRHGVPTPRILVPHDPDQVLPMAEELGYPVLLKPVVSLPGQEGVALAHDPSGALESYRAMGGAGRVLLQEYVSGDDSDAWMFNGYFDGSSRCLCGFTARKIRQHPAGMGVCAVGVCERNEQVLQTSERFLSEIGYRGPVDIDYRWDRRDGTSPVRCTWT
jgi:D-aspartate ligase